MTEAGRPAAVVDTNVFGAELTRRGEVVASAYRSHVEGRDLYVSFTTVAELRFGARLAGASLASIDSKRGSPQPTSSGPETDW